MSSAHRAAGWHNVNRDIRKLLAPLLPMPCRRCGREITKDMAWDAGHGPGGIKAQQGKRDLTGLAPEHASCNRSAGAKSQHALTQRDTRQAKRLPPLNWI